MENFAVNALHVVLQSSMLPGEFIWISNKDFGNVKKIVKRNRKTLELLTSSFRKKEKSVANTEKQIVAPILSG